MVAERTADWRRPVIVAVVVSIFFSHVVCGQLVTCMGDREDVRSSKLMWTSVGRALQEERFCFG
jgi:hypothetical protein